MERKYFLKKLDSDTLSWFRKYGEAVLSELIAQSSSQNSAKATHKIHNCVFRHLSFGKNHCSSQQRTL